MGSIGKLKRAASTVFQCGEVEGLGLWWKVRRVSDYQIASANHATISVLPVKQMIRGARAARGRVDTEDIDPTDEDAILEASIKRMKADVLELGDRDLKRLKDAQSGLLCAAVCGLYVGTEAPEPGDLEPVTLTEDGESDDDAGVLALSDLPPGVSDTLAGMVWTWLTGGEAGLSRLKSFRPATGAAASG